PSLAQKAQETRFERFMLRLYGGDASACRDARADEVRDPLVVDALDHDRSVRAVVELAETGHPRACLARNTGGTYPHGRRSQKLREVSLSHHLAAIDDRHRVANLLDLAQEVRVEEQHGPSVAEAADALAHVVAADR